MGCQGGHEHGVGVIEAQRGEERGLQNLVLAPAAAAIFEDIQCFGRVVHVRVPELATDPLQDLGLDGLRERCRDVLLQHIRSLRNRLLHAVRIRARKWLREGQRVEAQPSLVCHRDHAWDNPRQSPLQIMHRTHLDSVYGADSRKRDRHRRRQHHHLQSGVLQNLLHQGLRPLGAEQVRRQVQKNQGTVGGEEVLSDRLRSTIRQLVLRQHQLGDSCVDLQDLRGQNPVQIVEGPGDAALEPLLGGGEAGAEDFRDGGLLLGGPLHHVGLGAGVLREPDLAILHHLQDGNIIHGSNDIVPLQDHFRELLHR
mmetsp:Transcript_75189/g.200705  ORF Transcript_75189/g.200705 Transcript_75189/m.200705 type:complete len:311 (-) Transcript_75189:1172-2104(-)